MIILEVKIHILVREIKSKILKIDYYFYFYYFSFSFLIDLSHIRCVEKNGLYRGDSICLEPAFKEKNGCRCLVISQLPRNPNNVFNFCGFGLGLTTWFTPDLVLIRHSWWCWGNHIWSRAKLSWLHRRPGHYLLNYLWVLPLLQKV